MVQLPFHQIRNLRGYEGKSHHVTALVLESNLDGCSRVPSADGWEGHGEHAAIYHLSSRSVSRTILHCFYDAQMIICLMDADKHPYVELDRML
jgi:hypothetical protein